MMNNNLWSTNSPSKNTMRLTIGFLLAPEVNIQITKCKMMRSNKSHPFTVGRYAKSLPFHFLTSQKEDLMIETSTLYKLSKYNPKIISLLTKATENVKTGIYTIIFKL